MMPSACCDEQGGTNAGERWDEIDEPERNDGHEPQEQQITERVPTKTRHQLVDGRPGAADQDFADGPARDQKNDGAADCCTDDRAKRAKRVPNTTPPVTVSTSAGIENATTVM